MDSVVATTEMYPADEASRGEENLRFGPSYRERLTLGDGTRMLIRLIVPGDKRHIVRGLERMSPESRYSRFMAARDTLSDAELRYLCEIDGINHFALCAWKTSPFGIGEGVAVARFVRLHDEPRVAEPAIAIIDDYQGRGLGRLLLERLALAARERGIETFRCELFPSNRRIRRMLARLGSYTVTHESSLSMTVEVDLSGYPRD